MNAARRVLARFLSRISAETETVSASEVERLPVGSIVWEWVTDQYGPKGRVNGGPLVVIPDGKLTPISNLPERADGGEPGGDRAAGFGREFALVRKGKGSLPTHGVAQRHSIEWQKALRK